MGRKRIEPEAIKWEGEWKLGKPCIKCGIKKPIEGDYFYTDNSKEDGKKSKCADCEREERLEEKERKAAQMALQQIERSETVSPSELGGVDTQKDVLKSFAAPKTEESEQLVKNRLIRELKKLREQARSEAYEGKFRVKDISQAAEVAALALAIDMLEAGRDFYLNQWGYEELTTKGAK